MKKIFLIALLIMTMTRAGWALEIIDWQQAVELTVSNNVDLALARETINEITKQKNITETAAGPQLNSDASINKSADSQGDWEAKDSQSLGISAKQLIYDGDYTKNSIAAAREKIQEQQYNYYITEANVRFSLRQYFCELLRSQQLLDLAETIVNRRKQQLDLVSLRYNAGLEHKGSYLTAKANLKKALSEFDQEKRNLAINREKLTYVMGVSLNNDFTVTANVALAANINNQPDFTKLVTETPLLKEVVSRRIQNRYNLEIARANYLPEVYLSGSYGKSHTSQANDSTDNDSWSIGANLSFNLYDGNKKKYETEKANSQLNQADLEIEKNRRNIALTMQETWNSLLNAVDDISVAQDFLAASEERATIASAQYSSGLISFDNWIIIEDDLISAQKQYLNARLDALIKEANWINAKGGILNENE